MRGLSYFLRGLRLTLQPGLRRYVLLPLAINVTGLAALIWYGVQMTERLGAWVESALPGWLDWLAWLLWPLFVVAALLVVFFGFILLANLIAAPFNGLLAEAVERRLSGRGPPPGGWRELPREVIAGLGGELRKLGYFLPRALPLLLLFLVPGLNVAAPFLWFGFSAWFVALEYMDFPMGNHGIRFADQRRLLARRRLLGLGFGASVSVALMVPLLQFLVIPAAVAGATALWVEELRE